jgi:uncharacterized protein involved in outer membrane biogenesis
MILRILLLTIIILLVGGFGYLNIFFKADAEKYASTVTGTKVEISTVTVNPFTGSVSFNGFDVGNPQGFQSENAIEFGSLYVNVNALSLFTNKIIVNEVKLDGAEIYYEIGVNGDNIRTILNNIKSSRGRVQNSDGVDREVLFRDLHLTNSKVVLAANLFGYKEDREVEISDIHLKEVNSSSGRAAAKQLGDQLMREIAGAAAGEQVKGYINKLGGDGDKVMEGLKGLF